MILFIIGMVIALIVVIYAALTVTSIEDDREQKRNKEKGDKNSDERF